MDDDLETAVVAQLIRMSKLTKALLGLKLSELGLHNGQGGMLMVMEAEVSHPVSVIAFKLSVRPASDSKMIEGLLKKGMVEGFASDKGDARVKLVRITLLGLQARAELELVHGRLDKSIAAGISQERLTSIHEVLSSIDTLLRAKLARLR